MRRYFLYFVLGLLFCIVFEYFVTYFYNRSQLYEYTAAKDDIQVHYSWGGYGLQLSSEQVNEANYILQGIGYDEYHEKTDHYAYQVAKIQEYKTLIIENRALSELEKSGKNYIFINKVRYTREEITKVYSLYSNLDPIRVEDIYRIYQAVYGSLIYSEEYEAYVRYVIDHSRLLSVDDIGGSIKKVTFTTDLDPHVIKRINARSLYVSEADKLYSGIDGLIYTKDGKKLVAVPRMRKYPVIADGCEIVDIGAFLYDKWVGDDSYYALKNSLKTITFPSSVKQFKFFRCKDEGVYTCRI